MTVEYAPRGLIGVLTPQANTTVEPEMAILMPSGVAAINARLMSAKSTIEERLVEYFDQFDQAVSQFANAPIGAIAIACTGASYLAGVVAEQEMLTRMSDKSGIPAITAASAVVDALHAIGARKIGLVSPYPAGLTRSSVGYWEARGFTVTAVGSTISDDKSFHPIYSLPSAQARHALDSIAQADIDAVIMLGTGMPTLRPIRDVPRLGRAPVMSCMLCLAWRSVVALDRATPSAESLLQWVDGTDWGPRLAQRLPDRSIK